MIQIVKNKKHIVVKRDGSEEEFDIDKLKKGAREIIRMAVEEEGLDESLTDKLLEELMSDMKLRVSDRIKSSNIIQEMIICSVNRVSEIHRVWDKISRNFSLVKYYKEAWGIKIGEYPDYRDVLSVGISSKKYNRDILSTFSDEEIDELSKMIVPDRDKLFTGGALELFISKNCKKRSKHVYFELPQHRYMALAIQLHYNERDRMSAIKEKYDQLSTHKFTPSTPDIMNALTYRYNPTSCVLIQVDDDSESIIEGYRVGALYSKEASGLGKDMSLIRASGSQIGTDGISSGPVAFIKGNEAIISAWNQKSARPGSECDYFPWWHYNAPEIIMLKDAGGKDEERARRLKYAMKWNRLLSRRIREGRDVYLFDPKDARDLVFKYGDEFEKAYEAYENKGGIRKRKISARELGFLFSKVRIETGHLYWMSMENVNDQRYSDSVVTMSNLCTEVVLPTKPLRMKKRWMTTDIDRKEYNVMRSYDGEVAVCNLSSINMAKWIFLDEEEKSRLAYSIMKGMDNKIETSFYPIEYGEIFNKTRRSIGIGVSNYAYTLALKKLRFRADDDTMRFTHEVFEDISYHLIRASIELAKERGRYERFDGSRWAEGLFPFELSIAPRSIRFDLKKDWDGLRRDLLTYGIRFENVMAIAPTQTSGLAINATEGTEPIKKYKTFKEGTYNIPFLVPVEGTSYANYDIAWNISNEDLIKLAAVRQIFIDQAQSVNLYYRNPDSAYQVINEIMLAEELGVKTLYYANSLKSDSGDGESGESACESCT